MVARLGNLSALKDFISFLSTVSGDISHITAPPFILAPSSLTEFPAYWAERPSLFTAPSRESSAEKRMLAVLKLYLASLQRQYYVGRTVKEGLKKPLNPFLGELFLCEFTDNDLASEKSSSSTVKVISEQVSHHPPTTAAYITSDEHGVHAEAYSTQHTTLSGTSVMIRQSGHAVLKVDKYGETYLMPLPDVQARSVLTGSPWPELNDTYKILSSSGFTAEMRFTGKKMWGGSRNCFEASIYRTVDSKETALYTLSGSWSSSFSIKNAAGEEIELFDLADAQNQPAPMTIKPVEEQTPWESRKAWAQTFDAIRKADNHAVTTEKSKLENAQRQLRKKEQKEGKTWDTMFFDLQEDVNQEDVIEKLFDQLDDHEASRLRGMNGCWRFNKAKQQRWEAGNGSQRPATPFG
jgi:oxysterol-binding protein-related protein 9/10/11